VEVGRRDFSHAVVSPYTLQWAALQRIGVVPHYFYSKRELTFTFAIRMLSPVRLSSVCRLTVTFVRTTQPVEIFGNVFSPSGTLAIR